MTKVVVNKKPHQVRVLDLRPDATSAGEQCMRILCGNKKGTDARTIPVAEVYRLLQKAWQQGYDTCTGEYRAP